MSRVRRFSIPAGGFSPVLRDAHTFLILQAERGFRGRVSRICRDPEMFSRSAHVFGHTAAGSIHISRAKLPHRAPLPRVRSVLAHCEIVLRIRRRANRKEKNRPCNHKHLPIRRRRKRIESSLSAAFLTWVPGIEKLLILPPFSQKRRSRHLHPKLLTTLGRSSSGSPNFLTNNLTNGGQEPDKSRVRALCFSESSQYSKSRALVHFLGNHASPKPGRASKQRRRRAREMAPSRPSRPFPLRGSLLFP